MKITTVKDTTLYRRSLDDFDAADPAAGDVRAAARRREMAAARAMIAEIFGDNVMLTHDAAGAPSLEYRHADESPLPLPYVSVSHSRSEIVIALNDETPVGVDVEEWRNSLMKVKSRFLTEAESEVYNSSRLLLRAWAMKEALFKAALEPGITLIDCALPLGESGRAMVAGRRFDVQVARETPTSCIAVATPLEK